MSEEEEKQERPVEEKPKPAYKSGETWLSASGYRNFFFIGIAFFVLWFFKFITEQHFLWGIAGLLCIQLGVAVYKRFGTPKTDYLELQPINPADDYPFLVRCLRDAGFNSVKIIRMEFDQKYGPGSSASEIVHFLASFVRNGVRKPLAFGISRFDKSFTYIEENMRRVESTHYSWHGGLKYPEKGLPSPIFKIKQQVVRLKPVVKEGEEEEQEEEQ